MAQHLEAEIFLNNRQTGITIDVRTPAEFAAGHIPEAHNIPLFSNEQHAEVGTIYKKQGKDAAVVRGLELVAPCMVEIVKSAKKLTNGRPVFLYCFRGGMRSSSVAWLLETAGMEVSLLEGGYKAYRNSFDKLLEQHAWKFIMLAGATGCGKTELLHLIAKKGLQILDLEALAHHKGSAFGGIEQKEQPTTEQFINLLHETFRNFDPKQPVCCECESLQIGHVYIPQLLFSMIGKNTIINIEMERSQRLDRIMHEYGNLPKEALIDAFRRIEKRMGSQQANEAIAAINSGDIRKAADLGLAYYDKTYSHRHADNNNHVISFVADNNDMEGSAEKLMQMVRHCGLDPQSPK